MHDPGVRKFCGWLMMFLGCMAIAGAQALGVDATQEGADELPAPPPALLRDEAGFFSQQPEVFRQMLAAVKQVEQQRGFRIYLLVEPVLLGTTAQEYAGKLQQAWLPDGNGVVMVYEVDSKSLGLGRGNQGSEVGEERWGVIPAHELVGIITRATTQTGKNATAADYLKSLVLQLSAESEAYFQKRDAPVPEGRGLRITVLVLGSVALLALAGMGLGLLLRRVGGQAARRYAFPASTLPQRLGAPFGGGKVMVHRFGRGGP